MRQGRLNDIAEPLKVQKCNPADYIYSRPVVEQLLDGYWDGVGDTEQRADLIAGLKRIGQRYASVLVLDALGVKQAALAERFGVNRKTIWVWKKDAVNRLLAVMNGGAK